MNNYPEKPKNSNATWDDRFPKTMFYWRLFIALIIPASILAGLFMIPVWLTG